MFELSIAENSERTEKAPDFPNHSQGARYI